MALSIFSMTDKYRSILLFGAPGVGKGTQGKKLGETPGFIHLATGDIFRGLNPETPEGQEFVKYSTQGMLVPDELTVEIWKKHVARMIESGSYDPTRDVLVLDGMPRSVNQVKLMDGVIEVLAVVQLIPASVEAMVERIKKRARDEGRHDDTNESVIRNRFAVYENETAPVIHEYDKSLIREVDGMGTIDEVFEWVQRIVKTI